MNTSKNARHPLSAIGAANGPTRPALAVTGLGDGGSTSDLALLPKGYPVRKRGSCVPAAMIIAAKLDGAEVIEGHVNGHEHTWVEHNGRVIDPTIRQFKWWRRGAAVAREVHRRLPFHIAELLWSMERAVNIEAGLWWRTFDKWMGSAQ